MKLHSLQNSFNGGIFSPKMLGRVDYARYPNAMKDALNVIPMVQGGVRRRDGSKWVHSTPQVGSDGDIRLIPFTQSAINSYILHLYGSSMRIFKNEVLLVNLTSPYTGANTKDKIRYSHSSDSMVFTQPTVAPHRLVRVSDALWRLSPLTYDVPPLGEIGVSPANAITLSGLTGTITITSGGSDFLAGDVGRQIAAGAGLGRITAQGGTTATVAVEIAFDATSYASDAWTILDSPLSNVTPSDVNIGQNITLTASIATWRTSPTDTGRFVRINDGIVQITGYTSTTVVNATVIQKLTSASIAYGGGWSILSPAFSEKTGYPVACAIYEGRLVFGGTASQPNKMWFSEAGNIRNFAPGLNPNDPFERQVTSDRQDAIQHIVASRSLLVLTYGSEFSVFASDDGPLTPTTVTSRPQSTYGCDLAAPEQVGLSVIYAQRGARKIRAADFDGLRDGYVSPDISEIADHLVDSVKEIHYQSDPNPILWVINENSVVSCTFSADQSVLAWSRHTFPGTVSSMAVVPGAVGDDVYICTFVNKPTGGTDIMLLKFDKDYYYDAGYIQFVPSSPGDIIPDIPWLANMEYGLTIDEDYIGSFTAGAAGQITLPPSIPIYGFRRNLGLSFDSYIDLLPPEFQAPITIQGKITGISEVVIRVLETRSILVNGEPLLNRSTAAPSLNLPMPLVTGDFRIHKIGVARSSPPIRLQQGIPAPYIILACIRTISVGD